jgi:hypothetical protein
VKPEVMSEQSGWFELCASNWYGKYGYVMTFSMLIASIGSWGDKIDARRRTSGAWQDNKICNYNDPEVQSLYNV